LLVLFIWDRSHTSSLPTAQSTALRTSPQAASTTAGTPIQTPTLSAELKLSLEAVVGVGNLNLEYILIRNNGEEVVNLAGWQLIGSEGEVYTFPNLRLNQDGAVRLYSKSGTDSVIELYWGAEEALWSPGEQVALKDSTGKIYSTYQVP
jgi:hypothetical protein